jgi:hypothetical protein
MSDLEQKPESNQEPEENSTSKGPNLVFIYSLIAFALIAATFIAGLIVLPFYRRR